MRGLRRLIATCVFSTALFAANSPYAGTWKLNTAKSKFAPGTGMKEAAVTFEAVGDQMKRTVAGVDSDGQQMNESSTIAWDGKDHKIADEGGAAITAAVNKVNDRTLHVIVKNNGKLMETVHAVVSSDGKKMTATVKGQDCQGAHTRQCRGV